MFAIPGGVDRDLRRTSGENPDDGREYGMEGSTMQTKAGRNGRRTMWRNEKNAAGFRNAIPMVPAAQFAAGSSN